MVSRDALALSVLLGLQVTACETQRLNVGYDLPAECPGDCVRLPPLGFDGPALIWLGPAGEAPECPDRAPVRVFEGIHGIQDGPLNCPPCSCSQPTCNFPEGVIAGSGTCAGVGNTTPFPAPSSWDGSCTSAGVVSSSELGSVTISPVTQESCEPIIQVPEKPEAPPSFTAAVLGCAGDELDGVCPDPGFMCLPSAAPPPPGFRQCIMYLGPDDASDLQQCPVDYPEQHVFYAGVEDTRECRECTCAQTAASECTAWVSTYDGSTCEPGSLLATSLVAIGSPIPACTNIAVPDAELRSIQATWQTNNPGACEADGGDTIGHAQPTGARRFCCQPPPGSAP
jgi:hypothetical protein